MEIIILIVVGVIACWWLFALGKRIGSKKGYHVGRQHRRKSQRGS